MARVLVTGGAGFIGSHLVEALLLQGERVRVLDDLSTGRREHLAAVAGHPSLELVVGDLLDPERLRSEVQGVGVVFHQAAVRSVPRSVEDPWAAHEVNATGTLRLLLAAREAGVRRVVYASSSSVYGHQETLPLHEEFRPAPLSPYAVSKLAGEHYCRVFAALYGLETVGLRYFNVFGPRQDPASRYAAVIPRFITAALRGEPLEVHGDGKQTRDFTYVSNVVEANLRAATAPGVSGAVFNVAGGERHSVLDLVRAFEELLGRELPVAHTPPRPGDVRDTQADVTRAREALGLVPTVGFRDGLRRTLAAFQAS